MPKNVEKTSASTEKEILVEITAEELDQYSNNTGVTEEELSSESTEKEGI